MLNTYHTKIRPFDLICILIEEKTSSYVEIGKNNHSENKLVDKEHVSV